MISIIVPVYNACDCLERCLNSIEKQSYRDFEVILIDDGSKDGSSEICDKFEQKDNRFRVIHQKNQGPSAARNTGLKNVQGDFLCCVDSDDELRPDALEHLLNKMESSGADVCIFAWKFIYSDKSPKEYHFSEEELNASPEELYKLILQGDYKGGGGNPWNKMWRLKKSEPDNGINLFDESIQIYEDMLWVLQNLEKVNKVVIDNECLYNYYILDTSISRRGDAVERQKKFCLGAKRVYEYVAENHKSAEYAAQCWYRDRFCRYLRTKDKCSVEISEQDKKVIRSFSAKRKNFRSNLLWIRFIYIRYILCR